MIAPRTTLALCLVAALSAPREGAAQAPAGTIATAPPSTGRQSAAALLDPLEPDKPEQRWDEGRARWFLSGTFDMGFLYLRPRFSAGFGQPHHRWVGMEANPLASGEGAGGYLGLRGALPAVNLRVGGRFFHTFERSFLCPTMGFSRPTRCDDEAMLEFYDREDIESRVGPQSIYLTLESELTVELPLGPGEIQGEVAASYVMGVDEGYFVYEETLKAVLAPPWAARFRLGYSWPLDIEKAVKIGVVAELLRIQGRDLNVWRGGLTGSVRLYNNLEARGIFVPVLLAEDALGAAGGDTFLLGIRYRWATGP